MINRIVRIAIYFLLPLAIGLSAWLFLVGPQENVAQTLTLTAPVFVQSARAEGDTTLAGIVNEAGIAGYFQTTGPITINNELRTAFRTIEDETSTYIIGSLTVPGYPESYDVHAYVNSNGWIMTYYLKGDPAGKIIDWAHYRASNKTSIQTVLENVAAIVAGAAGKPYTGLSYYDFRNGSANRMMLIAEDMANGSTFTVQLPSSFTYFERSWSIWGQDVYLDGVRVWDGSGQLSAGSLAASQLLPDTPHTIEITYYSDAVGGLALVYQEP